MQQPNKSIPIIDHLTRTIDRRKRSRIENTSQGGEKALRQHIARGKSASRCHRSPNVSPPCLDAQEADSGPAAARTSSSPVRPSPRAQCSDQAVDIQDILPLRPLKCYRWVVEQASLSESPHPLHLPPDFPSALPPHRDIDARPHSPRFLQSRTFLNGTPSHLTTPFRGFRASRKFARPQPQPRLAPHIPAPPASAPMPPQLRAFGGGPGVGAPFHQAGFPSHGQPQGGPLGNQYLNANAQLNPFTPNNINSFNAAALNGAAGFPDTGFGSQSARMGFAHGPNAAAAALQQPQQQHGGQVQHNALMDHPTMRTQQSNKGRIREVWKHNLEEEMAVLRDIIDKYPYVAMDTEFPGVVARPMGGFRGKSDYHYQCLRTNVDMLKVIQIGITLFNEDGETPPARPGPELGLSPATRRHIGQGPFPYSWQFNFKFSLKDDMYNEKSIESLQQAGIDFNLLERDGIDPHQFASLLIPSGLVCFDNVRWISFHGGYDFGYLTKLLICTPLPNDEVDFDHKMKLYFPKTYDVKHLMKHAIRLHNSGMLTPSDPGTAEILQKFEHKSGLENIAETLKIKRIGSAHQAGSDSLLTGKVFFQMRDRIFNGEIPDDHLGKVWGLGIPDIGLPMSMMGQGGDQNGGQNGNTPSTPNTGTAHLATTPAQNHNTNGLPNMGPMTPGGGGGVFGNFAFGGNGR
ncbi:hypothetical protein MKX07_000883 [Trichoderma sp. CBMAI-0711]|nr:hypothetical protein MKX07_000883 [Trichoderma sp. CBMAI-0711]